MKIPFSADLIPEMRYKLHRLQSRDKYKKFRQTSRITVFCHVLILPTILETDRPFRIVEFKYVSLCLYAFAYISPAQLN